MLRQRYLSTHHGYCEVCGRKFVNGRSYTQHVHRCLRNQPHSIFHRYTPPTLDDAKVSCNSQDEHQTLHANECGLTDDYFPVPLTESTLEALGNGQTTEVFTPLSE
jgi:hypothetical protein